MDIEFSYTEKGKRKLYLHGHFFYKERHHNGRIFWKCEMYQKTKCRARVTTFFDELIKFSFEHNHCVGDATILFDYKVGPHFAY